MAAKSNSATSTTTAAKAAAPKVTRTRVAPKATAKKATAKAAPKAAAKRTPKAAPKPEPVVAPRRPNRSNEEWDKLALATIVPALQAGTSMTEIRAQYGAGPTIRRALDRVGYDTKGRKVESVAIKAAGKALAARVAKRRQAGAAWWRLEHETGKSQDELKALLAKHGHASLTDGRVIISARGKKEAAKS